ncbi:MAG: ribosome silencing factor [Bacteroidota bacterium]
MNAAERLASVAIDSIRDKKGSDIVRLDLRKINNAICDFFIICNGESSVQNQAIADHIIHSVKGSLKERVWHVEGYENAGWILLDYTDVVIHIFSNSNRDFYKLEELWADAKLDRLNY